jgi:hypothetical protein
MNCTHSIAQINPSEHDFQETAFSSPYEREFSNDVETFYECERIMALPGYRQLPLDEQAEVARTRERILQNWQAVVSVQPDDFSAPHDDRLLRHKLNMLRSLGSEYAKEALPNTAGHNFSRVNTLIGQLLKD